MDVIPTAPAGAAPIVHRSKVDPWLRLLYIAGAVLIVLLVLVLPVLRGLSVSWGIVLPAVAVGAGLPLWLLQATDYTIDQATLRVRSGPFRWRIPLVSIIAVAPTRAMVSAPALSMDRLEIHHAGGAPVLVSPEDQDAFLRDLEAAVRRRRD